MTPSMSNTTASIGRHGRSSPRTSSATRGEEAVDELGRVVGAAVLAAELDGLGQGGAGRDVELGGELEGAEAQHGAVGDRHAGHRPAPGVAAEQTVELDAVVG